VSHALTSDRAEAGYQSLRPEGTLLRLLSVGDVLADGRHAGRSLERTETYGVNQWYVKTKGIPTPVPTQMPTPVAS
jgi:hypothetical protein